MKKCIVFVDIEWRRNGNIVQVASLFTIEKNGILLPNELYSSILQQQRPLSKKEWEFMNLDGRWFRFAKSFHKVCDELSRKIAHFKRQYDLQIVMWNRDGYRKFIQKFKIDDLKFQRVLILQDFLNSVDLHYTKSLSLEDYCKLFHICLDRYVVHNAFYDVSILWELHEKIGDIMDFSQQRIHYKKASTSHRIHQEGCPYIKKMKEPQSVDRLRNHWMRGNELCKKCLKFSFRKLTNRLTDSYPTLPFSLYYEQFKKLCIIYKFRYKWEEEDLKIITKRSRWKLEITDGYIGYILHQNIPYKRFFKKYKSYDADYHIHTEKFKSLFDLLNYIYRHDKKNYLKEPMFSKKVEEAVKSLDNEKNEISLIDNTIDNTVAVEDYIDIVATNEIINSLNEEEPNLLEIENQDEKEEDVIM